MRNDLRNFFLAARRVKLPAYDLTRGLTSFARALFGAIGLPSSFSFLS